MPISNITNGESGSDTRTSLNQVIDKVNDIEAAADVTDAGNVGPAIGGATVITTLGDTDQIPVVQSNVLKSLAYSALKTLLGAIYQAKATILGTLGGLTNAAGFLTNDGAGVLSYTAVGTGVGTALGVNLGAAGSVLVTDYAADAGSTDAYVATLNPAPTALITGAHYRFMANTANMGAATIDFNGLGAKTIVKAAGGITTALTDNDIRAGQWVDVVYDGTNMQMQSTLGNASAFNPASPGPIGGTTPASAVFTQLSIGTTYAGSTLTVDGDLLVGGCRLNFGGNTNYLRGASGTILDDGPLVMGQITAPSAGTNQAKLYAEDVSGNAQMFVMGEDGGKTQLSGTLIPSGLIRLKGYTVGTLPTGTQGDTAYVTDALTPASLATVVGGGAAIVKVFYNGTNWIVQ